MIHFDFILETRRKALALHSLSYSKFANQPCQAGLDALHEAESAAPWSHILWLRDFVVLDNFHAHFLF